MGPDYGDDLVLPVDLGPGILDQLVPLPASLSGAGPGRSNYGPTTCLSVRRIGSAGLSFTAKQPGEIIKSIEQTARACEGEP